MSNRSPFSPDPSSTPVNSVAAVPPRPGRGLAFAGLVLAAISLLASLFIFLVVYGALIVALMSSLAGIVLSALSYRSPSGRSMAIVGLVVSIVVFDLLVLLLLYLTPVRVVGHPPTPTVVPRYVTP